MREIAVSNMTIPKLGRFYRFVKFLHFANEMDSIPLSATGIVQLLQITQHGNHWILPARQPEPTGA